MEMNETNLTEQVKGPDPCYYEPPLYLEGRFWLVSVFGSSVAVVSSCENGFLFCTLAKKKQHLNSHLLYIMLLAFFDFFIAIAYIPLMSVSLLADYLESPILLSAWYFYMRPMITVSHIAMTASSFLILAASFERYCITCFPGRLRKVQQWRRKIAIFAVVAGVVTKITLYHEYLIIFNPECRGSMTEFNIQLSSMATEYYYNLVWRLGFRNLVTVLLPFFGLLVLNFLIVRRLKRAHRLPVEHKLVAGLRDSHKSRVRAATITLLLIVFTYLLANILNVIVTFWEYFDITSLTGRFLMFYTYSVDIVSITTILAGAFRLPIYVTCMPQLRSEFLSFTKKILGKRRKTFDVDFSSDQFQYAPMIIRISEMLMRYPNFSSMTSMDNLSEINQTDLERKEEVFL